MSGPNPPGPDSEELESGVEPSQSRRRIRRGGTNRRGRRPPRTDEDGPDGVYSRAYSAPESEHSPAAPTCRADLGLYDYDGYDERPTPTTRGDPSALAVGGRRRRHRRGDRAGGFRVAAVRPHRQRQPGHARHRTTTSVPPMQDEITHNATTRHHLRRRPARPPPPPPPTDRRPRHRRRRRPPAPPPAPPPAAAAGPARRPRPPPHRRRRRPARGITYSVTGTKAPLDRISVTYTDASGRRRTQHNVYIPWSMTVTPISKSDVGSVQASSLLRLSRLNCSITTSDGTVLSSNRTTNRRPAADGQQISASLGRTQQVTPATADRILSGRAPPSGWRCWA